MACLRPPRVCLREHIKRVNFQVGIWKRVHNQNPDIPSPMNDNGWVMVGQNIKTNGVMVRLADILETMENDDDNDNDDSTVSEWESAYDEGSDNESESDVESVYLTSSISLKLKCILSKRLVKQVDIESMYRH